MAVEKSSQQTTMSLVMSILQLQKQKQQGEAKYRNFKCFTLLLVENCWPNFTADRHVFQRLNQCILPV